MATKKCWLSTFQGRKHDLNDEGQLVKKRNSQGHTKSLRYSLLRPSSYSGHNRNRPKLDPGQEAQLMWKGAPRKCLQQHRLAKLILPRMAPVYSSSRVPAATGREGKSWRAQCLRVWILISEASLKPPRAFELPLKVTRQFFREMEGVEGKESRLYHYLNQMLKRILAHTLCWHSELMFGY